MKILNYDEFKGSPLNEAFITADKIGDWATSLLDDAMNRRVVLNPEAMFSCGYFRKLPKTTFSSTIIDENGIKQPNVYKNDSDKVGICKLTKYTAPLSFDYAEKEQKRDKDAWDATHTSGVFVSNHEMIPELRNYIDGRTDPAEKAKAEKLARLIPILLDKRTEKYVVAICTKDLTSAKRRYIKSKFYDWDGVADTIVPIDEADAETFFIPSQRAAVKSAKNADRNGYVYINAENVIYVGFGGKTYDGRANINAASILSPDCINTVYNDCKVLRNIGTPAIP